jgi:4-amino-4-deoxy-L-arabinose transferase-like glycosyltransferase
MTAVPARGEPIARDLPWLAALDGLAAALLRALAFRPYAGAAALAFLCCILFLPGIASVPVTDRDEARFAQASKQMVETGNYIDIRFQNEPRYKKPIGIYWLQAAAVKTAAKAGASLDDIWAYRIPSFLGALVAVLLTFWAGRAVIGRERALAAAALFAICLTLSLEARIAKSDAALIASIVLAQGALFRLYMAPQGSATRGLAALFWLGLGAGILIKGPVAPGLAVLTAAAALLCGHRRGWIKNLHWGWGVPLLLLVTLPWFIAIGISSHGEFFRSSLGQDFAGKLQSGQEAHWGPPGYYLVAFWLTFWPAVLFVTLDGLRRFWRERRSRRVLFLLAWIVPWWLIIEAIPTKLPHYALPLYPAIAMAAVLSIKSVRDDAGPGTRLAAILWFALAGLLAIAFGVLSWIAEAPQLPLIAIGLIAFACAAGITAAASWRGYTNAALCGAVLSAVIFYTAAFRLALPGLQPIWISQTAATAAQPLKSCSAGPIGFAGFSAPSLVFLNGTQTVLTGGAALADLLASNSIGAAFVNWNQREEFEQAFRQKTGAMPRFLGCADGIDINGRGPTRLQIYAGPDTADRPGCAPSPAIACRQKESVRWRRLLSSKF